MTDPAPGPKIFLSHRQEDRKTAELIRKVLRDLGFPESDIFDFTGGEETGRISGSSPVTKEIARACHDSSLFILIYTVKDEKWDDCLFETGLALNAR